MNGSVCGMNGNFEGFTNLKASCRSFYFHNFRTLPFTFSAEFLASKSWPANWRPTITWKQLTDKPNKTKCQREASGMQCSAKGHALWYTMYQKKGNRGKEMGKTGKKIHSMEWTWGGCGKATQCWDVLIMITLVWEGHQTLKPVDRTARFWPCAQLLPLFGGMLTSSVSRGSLLVD